MSGIAVHLLRHGVPVRPGLLLGHADEAPLPAGVAACLAQAEKLAFERVVSSDLARAVIPARDIAASRALPHAVDARWRELDFGAWTGLAPHEADAAAHARFWDDPEAHPPPGGERWSQARARVGAALAQIEAPTLVVTHGGAMRAALAVLCAMDHRQAWAFDLPYASVLSLRLWPSPEPGSPGPVAQIVGLAA
ncbi:histidine phosphatase family protein [Novosphingobium soli]|uniref:Histidine phosphatase family protein n=1 Tax=Novosphingobium soli TaxID=574956 RepID=A0ABV6D0Y6_9SPHN